MYVLDVLKRSTMRFIHKDAFNIIRNSSYYHSKNQHMMWFKFISMKIMEFFSNRSCVVNSFVSIHFPFFISILGYKILIIMTVTVI